MVRHKIFKVCLTIVGRSALRLKGLKLILRFAVFVRYFFPTLPMKIKALLFSVLLKLLVFKDQKLAKLFDKKAVSSISVSDAKKTHTIS